MAWKHYFIFLKTSKVSFSRLWLHHFQLQKRYLSALLRTLLPTAKKVPICAFHEIAWTEKKVPLSRFKALFGKGRNGWRADNIDVKISFTRKLKIPDFFFKKTGSRWLHVATTAKQNENWTGCIPFMNWTITCTSPQDNGFLCKIIKSL